MSRRTAAWFVWAVCAFSLTQRPVLPPYSTECELECTCLRLLA